MKRIAFLVLALAVGFSFTACTIQQAPNERPTNQPSNVQPTHTPSNSPEAASKVVSVDDFLISFEVLPPNNTGTVFAEFTFVNNSSSPIIDFSIAALLKDSNKRTHYSTYFTVMPGETSPKFTSFGPATGDKADIEFLSFEYSVYNDDGTVTHYEYDSKLQQYKTWETTIRASNSTINININDFALTQEIEPPDSIGSVYLNMTYTNNTQYPIVGFSLAALLKDSNEITYYSCYDTILPGETSANFVSFGPLSQQMTDVEFMELSISIAESSGSDTYMYYNYKLGIWTR